MTNLFVGNEDIEFGLVSADVITSGGGSNFDPLYSRCALRPLSAPGIIHQFSDDLLAYITANNKMWYGGRWRGGGGSFSGTGSVIQFCKGGLPFFEVQQAGANNCQPVTYDGSGTPTLITGYSIPQSTTHTEHSFYLSIGTSGFIRWFINEVLWWEFVGNTAALGAAGTGALMDRTIRNRCNTNNDSYWSEMIATSADDSRLGKRLATLYATADSAVNNAWNGGFGDVDEITEDTTDTINTATAGLRESHIYTDLPSLSPGVIPQTIVISAKMQSQVGSPQNAKGLIRQAGTNYESAAKPVSNVPSNVQFYFPQNPATVSTWTPTEVNGSEYGLTSVT